LIPAAFIEGHQVPVLQAKKRLANRAQQNQLMANIEGNKNQADEINSRIKELESSYPAIDQRMSQLKARKELLVKELKEISIAIADDKKKKEELPETISKMREEMATHVRNAVRARKSLKPISGSAADNERTINEIDQICLNAMNAI